MPTLQWIGKEAVVGYADKVPFRVLEKKYTYGNDDANGRDAARRVPAHTTNKIIHGDNLEALKALLPEYEGRIKCIYIDPPYNTGNSPENGGWIYDDNVDSPRIRHWLGKVVGKESEDLSRHDKWLCMMYPRLKLLQKLLSNDGIIFISIDDNEVTNLRLICDEIFGKNNYVDTIIWKNKYGSGAKTISFIGVHEYIVIYGKKTIEDISCELSQELQASYNKKDSKYNLRGGYFTQPLMTNSLDDRPNLQYSIEYNGDIIKPRKQWVWEKNRLLDAIEKDEVVFSKQKDGSYSVRSKQYLKDENGIIRKGKPLSIVNGPFTQEGTAEIEAIFGKNVFKFTKPSELVKYLISLEINHISDKDSIILDSFAGSGTTAHAVLNLNKADGGNRKFILVEMEDYAESITAERVKRVIDGYGDTEGTGGEFDFYELGEPVFDEDKNLNENIGEEKIREYIWFSETHIGLQAARLSNADGPSAIQDRYFLGKYNNCGYWFFYQKETETTLDDDFLKTMAVECEQYVIYADKCILPKDFMNAKNIVFKKIPRDIKKL